MDMTSAASPPGSWYAVKNSKKKNSPMLSAPSAAALNHQLPRGHVRVTTMSTIPAGRALTVAARSGRSAGRNSVVTR
ncbi:hypothetical protein StoSoilB20_11800 [Arthrobacter sp. StoSoilB20]|nr:hypothetical protein StoSoilB20_11800 [Arthrobacter sp. StoSoilB20]